jgi:hypothetical protein
MTKRPLLVRDPAVNESTSLGAVLPCSGVTIDSPRPWVYHAAIGTHENNNMKSGAIFGPLAFLAFIVFGATLVPGKSAAQQKLSDSEVRLLLVQESIAAYNGACPCPETRNSRGARCGGNSAYSRPGGSRPLCYPTDVTDAMIQRYRDLLAKQ